MIEPPDYYADLGISREATSEEIRRAYHKAARQMHPDVNEQTGATDLFIKVQAAYDILSDPARRAAYDRSLPPARPPLKVDCSITYSRPSLIRLDEPQLIYALLEITSPAEARSRPSPPLNVCLVLDRSTSMQGERMDTVKATAIELTRQMKSQDVFSIVTFSDRAEVLIPAGQQVDPAAVETRIQKLQTGGGTEIFRGLEAGYFEVRRKFSGSYTNHIILLTDGRTYGDEAACMRVAEQASAYGIGISALGIGEEWNDAFLDTLTARTGGGSVYVSRNSDIKQFLKEKINRLGQVYAERVMLDLQPRPGVELMYAFRISPDASPLANTSTLRLGVLPKDPSLTFLLEFKVGPILEATPVHTLAEGHLQFDVPTQRYPGGSLDIHLTRSVSDTEKITPPPTRLLKAISRLTLYRMQENAHQYLADGALDEASRSLHNLATHLFNQGEPELARTAQQESDNIARNLGVSEAGKKQIKYGTRALLLPAGLDNMPSPAAGERVQ